MTPPDSPEPVPQSDAASATSAAPEPTEAEEPEPEPEPWTPERVVEWNAYYDLYVSLGVLLLVFVASSNFIVNSSLWTQLQLGRAIASAGAPVTTDTFSYTRPGASWVNIPWLFELSHAVLYRSVSDAVASTGDPADRAATAVKADQYAAGALVALDALARMLTALVLLSARRAGPGRWWSAVCVALAFGVTVSPLGYPVGLSLGGVAGPGLVAPSTWGVLLLAVEFWLIHRAVSLGRSGSLYALVPLFAVWANTDESFLVGLILLAAAAVGRVRPSASEPPGAPGLPAFFAVLGASALACVANPSFLRIYPAAFGPLLNAFRAGPAEGISTDQLSYFSAGLERIVGPAGVTSMRVIFVAYVVVGFASFALNRRRFSLGRFLVYTTAAALSALLIRYSPEFAVVLGGVLSLNGQEWYQDRLGTEGRLGWGWWAWSTLGRAVTLVVLFAFVLLAVTGYGAAGSQTRFGFGYDPDDFAFEAADYLKAAPITGNVLNTSSAQGDALIWRASPARKTFVDSRQHLFGPELRALLQKTRKALSEDDVPAWKPTLDEYKISAVIINPDESPRTYQVLSNSANWLPFYDGGGFAMFGRADAPADDLKFFKENRLEPESLAYKRTRQTPPTVRPPSPSTWMDSVFQARFHTRPQPHTESARRWLFGSDPTGAGAGFADPARCLLAVREARTALASKPDDTQAFRLLAETYRRLMIEETGMLLGIKPTPANAAQLARVQPRPDLLRTRYRQRVTALTYALQTSPPPAGPQDRQLLIQINMELHQLFLSVNYIDLARDRLQAVLDTVDKGVLTPEARASLSQDLAQLDEQVKKVQNQMDDFQVEQPQQFGPLQLAAYASNQGMPGLALRQLEEAERTGTNPALVKPQLLDLYCDTGQPEKAVEMLSVGGSQGIEDPSFGSEPGVAALRNGRAYFLIGNDEYAATIWEKYAIPRLRSDRVGKAMSSTHGIMYGEVKPAVAGLLEIPERISQQATWEFEAGLCRLEGGVPELAATHFTHALELVPNYNARPIIAYYLEKIGKPVPPARTESAARTSTSGATKDTKGPAGEKPKADVPKAKEETSKAKEESPKAK